MRDTVSSLVNDVHVALDEIAGTSVDSDFMPGFDTEIEAALLKASTELSMELPDFQLMPTVLGNDYFSQTVEEHSLPSGSSGISTGGSSLTPVSTGTSLQIGGVATLGVNTGGSATIGGTETIGGTTASAHVTNTDGSGAVLLPADFLRLVGFRMSGWSRDAKVITDGASNEGSMQASPWTRGTPQKPKVMLGTAFGGRRYLEYYTAAKTSQNGYVRTVTYLAYIPKPSVTSGGNTTTSSTTRYLENGLADGCRHQLIYRACSILMEGKQNSGLADRFRALTITQ